jgi:hypothetical protein
MKLGRAHLRFDHALALRWCPSALPNGYGSSSQRSLGLLPCRIFLLRIRTTLVPACHDELWYLGGASLEVRTQSVQRPARLR